MIPRTNDAVFKNRIIEMINYVKKNDAFPKRGKNDLKFSDGSCLMGEWFKSNREKISEMACYDEEAMLLDLLALEHIKKTDKESVADRLNSRIMYLIDFVKRNNYFPSYEDDISFAEGVNIYTWYSGNKAKIKDLATKGDIYAKELLSLEEKSKKSKKKNKYPNIITYQNRDYDFDQFAILSGVSRERLEEYLDNFCDNIYNIKPIEMERIRNHIFNVNRLMYLTEDDSKFKGIPVPIHNFCERNKQDAKVISVQYKKLLGMGLKPNAAVKSIRNEYKNNDKSIPVSWVYDAYGEELSDNNPLYDKNAVVECIRKEGLSYKDAILKTLINNKLSNYNEPSYMGDVVFYTLKSKNYKDMIEYSKNLFKLNDFYVKLIDEVKNDYIKINEYKSNNTDDRNTLLEELVNNYDYYNDNKAMLKEKYNLSKYDIMFIEARYNELSENRRRRK